MTQHPPDVPVDFTIGTYRHWRGDLYYALSIVRMHDSRRPYVLYHSLGTDGDHPTSLSIRPLAKEWDGVLYEDDCWTDEIDLDDYPIHTKVQRFTLESPQ